MMDFQHLKTASTISQILGKVLIAIGYLNSSLILPNLTLMISLTVLVVLTLIIRKFLIIKKLLKEKSVLLELTPPAFTEKTAYTTQQLFSVLHDLGERKTLMDRLLGRKAVFSFEIASTYNQGIRYIIRINKNEVGNLKRNLLSYLPQVKVQKVDEYLPDNIVGSDGLSTKVIEYKLKRHFAFPLGKQDVLAEHDPVAYITGMMTKLKSKELISYQIVLSPTETNEVHVINKKIMKKEDVLAHLNHSTLHNVPFQLLPLKWVFKGLQGVLSLLVWSFQTVANDMNSVKKTYQNPQYEKARQIITINPDKFTIGSIEGKINQKLFEGKIRLLIQVKEKQELSERVKGFTSSLAVFSVPGFQTLYKKKNFFLDKLIIFNFKNRLLSFVSNSSPYLFSSSEISDLYHFPFTRVTQTENIVKLHSQELPAPLSLKKDRPLDVLFAKNTYGGSETLIGLTGEEREKHMYIIGATGSGKTTMITSMASQDIKNGKGVAVIDPHGDLAETLLTCIPKERTNDLIYVNPDDLKFPIGINLLELTPGLDEDDILREKEFITESVISLFRKVFSESMAGHAHRIEYILRNAIQTALTLENPTLFTIYELLNNPPFQKNATKNLEDENLKNFWKYEYGKAGDYQKVKMISPVAARIGRFLFSPSAKRMLEQKKSTINFDEILDQQKILICNLAKGKLGEDTSEVLGIMIVAKIQLASLRRARMNAALRTPFYMYVDEFQNFATPSFIQMLSEARKYKTYLVMAEQSTSQQKDKNLVNVILANVGTVVSFRSANPDDERLMLPQFAPYIEKGDISNLPRYNFYIKISAVTPEEAFSGETIPVEIITSRSKIEKLIQSSRNLYAILYKNPPVIKTIKNTSSNTNNSEKNSTVQDVGAL